MDIYTDCPTIKTEHFTLRLLREEDAPDLYRCYHDTAAVALMNADNCDFGFFAETPEQMAETIRYWLQHYGWRSFVRFAVAERAAGMVIGTVEGFAGDTGVLRLDIASEWEQADLLMELLNVCQTHFRAWFGNQTLVIKAIPEAAERRKALERCGWTYIGPFRGYPHYYRVELL